MFDYDRARMWFDKLVNHGISKRDAIILIREILAAGNERGNMPKIRGIVRKVGSTWFYTVSLDDDIIFTDNTGSFEPVLEGCLFDVAVLKRLVCAGNQPMYSWDEVMEMEKERTTW